MRQVPTARTMLQPRAAGAATAAGEPGSAASPLPPRARRQQNAGEGELLRAFGLLAVVLFLLIVGMTAVHTPTAYSHHHPHPAHAHQPGTQRPRHSDESSTDSNNAHIVDHHRHASSDHLVGESSAGTTGHRMDGVVSGGGEDVPPPRLVVSLPRLAEVHDIVIELLPDRAPKHVAYIMAHAPGGKASRIYRVEARPTAELPDGPPYGLIQGNLDGWLPGGRAASVLPGEPTPKRGIKPGDVARIEGDNIFIALSEHDGWATSFTVFGRVDAATVERLQKYAVNAEVAQVKHSSGTMMRTLKSPLLANVKLDHPPEAQP